MNIFIFTVIVRKIILNKIYFRILKLYFTKKKKKEKEKF